jgi:hypothetical protein
MIENDFSDTLGEGSRWLERMVISILFFAVLFVEAIGLTLTIRTGRQISRGLADVTAAAVAIGKGEYRRRLPKTSQDELGKLSDSINTMATLIQASTRDLERTVQERTFELQNALRARDEFVSIASHELNTPLSAIKLQIQFRKRKLLARPTGSVESAPTEKVLASLENDERQVNRIIRLVQEMLDVSRLSAGRFTLKKERVDLSAIVRETLQRFSSQISASGIQVETRLESDVFGEWDPFRLEQVFTNLLTNAVKYGEGRPISVRVARVEGRALLSVRDEGMGIAREDQARVFRQFERAYSADRISGLGLGLFIVKELVESHQGNVTLISEVGKGSEFRVDLPLAKLVSREHERREPPSPTV